MKGEGDGERNKIFYQMLLVKTCVFCFLLSMQAYEKALIVNF